MNNMYGGVATPLALLHHNEINNPRLKHIPPPNHTNSRDESYNISRSPMRLPPLRESMHRDFIDGCENEPLLPNIACQLPRNGKKVPVEENLPPPPLPPHKNKCQRLVPPEMKYNPPWPRPQNSYKPQAADNFKPYLKPLPKPPGKESPSRHHRKHHMVSMPPPHQNKIPVVPQRTPERTPELLRSKIQTRPNPLAQRHHHHHRRSPLQRHYSDESLGGLYTSGIPQRIHSSADEISSLNHSPSISSSDESYSRTTDADVSPCVSSPLITDTQQFLYPSDIQVNPLSSPEVSPRASLDYIPPNCSLKNNSSDRTNQKRNNLPPNAVLALAATCNTVDSSIVTSPPILDSEDSCKGESCTSFEFVSRTNQTPTSLLRATSANGGAPAGLKHVVKQRSLDKQTRTDSDSVLEVNTLSASCKRSPSFKETEEIKHMLEEEEKKTTVSSEKSSKRDGCCQTDKKDLKKLRISPSGVRDKISPCSKVNNLDNCENTMGQFEIEIQKLLDEQNLLQNIPPKLDLNQHNKELALEPLVRYAPSNNNHQVGLAAIQALALGLRATVNPPNMSPSPRASSKEGSLKRGASPGPSESNKLAKVSPLDRAPRNVEDDNDCDMAEIQLHHDDDTDLESFEREEQRIEEEAAQEAEVKRLLEENIQEKLKNVENVILENELHGSSATAGDCSASEWSEDEDGGASEPLLNDRESTGYTTDDPALENVSMLNEAGLTDAEGALSDVNSVYNDHNHEGDLDDNTSMSSRASSRIFDSDAMMSLDSLSALYDSEYDNCCKTDDDLNAVSDLDRLNYFSVPANDVHLANIRSMSESITRNFGQPRSETDPDSDA